MMHPKQKLPKKVEKKIKVDIYKDCCIEYYRGSKEYYPKYKGQYLSLYTNVTLIEKKYGCIEFGDTKERAKEIIDKFLEDKGILKPIILNVNGEEIEKDLFNICAVCGKPIGKHDPSVLYHEHSDCHYRKPKWTKVEDMLPLDKSYVEVKINGEFNIYKAVYDHLVINASDSFYIIGTAMYYNVREWRYIK